MEPVSTRLQEAETALSLVEWAGEISRHGQAVPDDAPPAETRVCADGYTRRSPSQPYRVPEGYYRRIAWKAAVYIAVGVMLLLLLLELLKRGILRF